MIRILFKVTFATVSISLMLLVLGYTVQARNAREATPTMIGEGKAEKPFLVEFIEIRQDLAMGYLTGLFPELELPDAAPDPVNPLSLTALHDRASVSRAKAAQQAAERPKGRRSGTGSRPQSAEPPKLRVLRTSP